MSTTARRGSGFESVNACLRRQLHSRILYDITFGHCLVGCLAIATVLLLPLVLSDGYLLQIMQTIAFYSIAAIGLNILVGYQGQVSLGHGALFAIGAYASALASVQLGLSVWASIFCAVALAAVAGFLIGLPTLRARGHFLAMVTIALSIITFVVAQTWTEVTGGPAGLGGIPRPEWFDGSAMGSFRKFRPFGEEGPVLTGQVLYFWVCASFLLLAQLLALNLLRGHWGRMVSAVRQSEIAAEATGTSVYRVKLGTFTLSSAYAGLAGSLFAHQQGYIVSDTFTFEKSVEFLVFVILGGARSTVGPVIGTVLLVILPEALKAVAASEEMMATGKLFQGVAVALIVLTLAIALFQRLKREAGSVSARRLVYTLSGVGVLLLIFSTPQIVEHYLLVYGALLVVFLIAMPTGIAGLIRQMTSSIRKEELQEADLPPPTTLPSLSKIASPSASLVVENISMRFGGVRALEDVSLTVSPGSIHGLIGPNGSGKSTLVNVISGHYQPLSGRIELGGVSLTRLKPYQVSRHGVARTFQNIQLFKDLTVLDNVMMGFQRRRHISLVQQALRTRSHVIEEATLRDKALGILQFLGIANLAHAEAQSLPYGLQRMVEIARALATEPSVLLLDEPAAGVNPSELSGLSSVISKIRSAGVTVLLIEHHMDLVMSICDRVSVLNRGRKIAEGLPEEIQRNPDVISAYLGNVEDSFGDLRRRGRKTDIAKLEAELS